MPIENANDLYQAIVEFGEMLESDFQFERTIHDDSKACLLHNIMNEFETIYNYAKEKYEEVCSDD